MKVDAFETPPAEIEADALVLVCIEDEGAPASARALGDEPADALARLADGRELRGETGEVVVLHDPPGVAAARVAAVGAGPRADLDADSVRTAAANAARKLGGVGSGTVAWLLDGAILPPDVQARAVVDGTTLGSYDPARWRAERPEPRGIEQLLLCGDGATDAAEPAARAAVAAAWANRCRTLVDAPPNELTPEALAEEARGIAANASSLSVDVLGPVEIEAAGMTLVAAVSRGSRTPARVIVLRHEPAEAAGDAVLGLVGKGLTFDSGGLSLKPPASMEDMKSDMAGGAAVLAAVGAIAELGLPLRIVAVVPACENMPGGGALRPGEIVRSLAGKTVEITNTDAEGRLALADALTYIRGLGATHVLDLATLTGGMVVALGDVYAGLFGNDPAWVERIRAAGEATGDLVWPWPLHRSYRRYVESPFADLKNSSLIRQGTPVYAAEFLATFVGDEPWAHVDMAGTGYLERGRDDVYVRQGATGFGVRLAVEVARGLSARTST